MRVHDFSALACALSATLLLGACASTPKTAATGTAAPVQDAAPAASSGPNRFEMTRNGERMTADDFDAWMKARGIRIAGGKEAAPTPAPARRKPAKGQPKPKPGASASEGRASPR